MTTPEYVQLRAFSRVDGAYLGILWTVSFICSIIGMTQPLMGFVGTLTALASPFFAAKRLWKFRDNVRDGQISFLRSMAYYILTFFYASILFALAQYIYFAFIDNGYIVKEYISIMSTDEAQTMLKAYGLTAKQVKDSLNEMAATSPIMIVLNIMTMNITIGILMSLPVAAMTKKK
ncbi:MAG: DUF4199 domain-containing protein [Prevotella sp.]